MSLDVEREQVRDELEEVLDKVISRLKSKGKVEVQHQEDPVIRTTTVYIDGEPVRLPYINYMTFEKKLIEALTREYGPLAEIGTKPFQRGIPVAEKAYGNDKVELRSTAVALGPGYMHFTIKLKR